MCVETVVERGVAGWTGGHSVTVSWSQKVAGDIFSEEEESLSVKCVGMRVTRGPRSAGRGSEEEAGV